MARMTHPDEARRGKFLGSFRGNQVQEMREFIEETEAAMRHLPIHGEIVYSYFTTPHVWQVFILPESDQR